MRSSTPGGSGAVTHRRLRAWTFCASAVALALGTLAAATSASAQQAPAAAGPAAVRVNAAALAKHDYKRACAIAWRGHAACMALIRTDVAQHRQPAAHPDAAPTGYGYGPADLQNAYLLPSSSAGSGQTVAIVDAYDDPNAAADLAAYRSAYGLPPCGAGCFSKVNQNGQASPLPAAAGSSGWDVEESLDLDMVSAICPLCHILLVEANSNYSSDLGTAVNTAVNLGAKFVSNSYGAPESSSDPGYDSSYYNHPGVAVTASTGDSGYGVQYPAASRYVTAVGGTSLSAASNSRGWSETVWNGTGSGCSVDNAKPPWQTDTGCAGRTNSDVSAVADPNTGVAVYDTYSRGGWLEVGGTSAASPIIASAFALAGTPAAGTYPSSYIYQHTSSLFDVTSGANGSCSPAYLCTGETGYDGPTGWGTPNNIDAFTSPPPYQTAFQGSNTALWTAGTDGTTDTFLAMMSGTSPAITAVPGGYESAFQANTGQLWTTGTDGGTSGLPMMAGTSPAITSLAGGGYEVAFQANTGNLWAVGSDNHGDVGLGMMPGTSPSIVGLGGGGWEVAFQANTGTLWTTGNDIHGDWGLRMMNGTSPAITAVPGGYEVAYQDPAGSLETAGTYGNNDWNLGMRAGTSPSITAVPGGFEVAFQANTGDLWTVGNAGDSDWHLGMRAGTSPAITAVPGGFEVAFQANTGDLWTIGNAGDSDRYLPMMSGTSPAIAATP